MESRLAFMDLIKEAPQRLQARLINLFNSLQWQSDLYSGGKVTFSESGSNLVITLTRADGSTKSWTVT